MEKEKEKEISDSRYPDIQAQPTPIGYPDRPALALFAAELRAARQHAGLTRDELSAKVNYSSSLIGMIETGRRVP